MDYATNHRPPQVAGRAETFKDRSPKTSRTPVNNLRLSDLGKLIEGRHGFYCDDAEWAQRYFFAALPHLIVSRTRWLDAVREWACMWVPVLLSVHGADWIDDAARDCHAKPRKTPRQDRLCRLLDVQETEVGDFGLCTLTAAARPKKVRDGERREAKIRYKREKRAEDSHYTPREKSKAAVARAQGTTASAIRSKKWRERRQADDAENTDAQTFVTADERVSDPSEELSETAVAQYCVTDPNAFRTQQYRSSPERVSDPTTITRPGLCDPPSTEGTNPSELTAAHHPGGWR